MPFRRFIPLRTPEDGTPPAATPPVTPAPSAAPPDVASVLSAMMETITKVDSKVDRFQKEWVDQRREERNKFNAGKGETPNPEPKTATAPTVPAWNAEAMLAFRDAVDESGVTVTVAQRKILEKLYRAESDIADPVAWMKEQAATLGWRNASTPAPASTPATPPAPVTPPNTGAPTGTAAGSPSIPDDPALLTQSVIDQMSPEEAKQRYLAWKRRTGAFRHPFSAARDAERSNGQDLAHAAAALRQVLSGKK